MIQTAAILVVGLHLHLYRYIEMGLYTCVRSRPWIELIRSLGTWHLSNSIRCCCTRYSCNGLPWSANGQFLWSFCQLPTRLLCSIAANTSQIGFHCMVSWIVHNLWSWSFTVITWVIFCIASLRFRVVIYVFVIVILYFCIYAQFANVYVTLCVWVDGPYAICGVMCSIHIYSTIFHMCSIHV